MAQIHHHTTLNRRIRLGAALAAVAMATGCATVQNPSPDDPWESYNRTMYTINDHVDQALEGAGDVFVLVMDQIKFPHHGRIGEGDRLENSHPELFADDPSRDDGDAYPA